MSYIRAEEILPKELIETIQQYIDGNCIYIPSKEKKCWGSNTKTKDYYEKRNREIFDKYQSGVEIQLLAKEYCLSDKSIQRIIRQLRIEEKNSSKTK